MATAVLAVAFASLAVAGCGAGATATPAATHLEREDLIAVVRTLAAARPAVEREVAAAKTAWRVLANGLPGGNGSAARAPVLQAREAASKLNLPPLFGEVRAAAITGPGSSLVGLFRTYERLATRAWALIGASIDEISGGSAASARFARANVALYIESIYDAHFGLAQIGKHLLAGYAKLGGPDAFGASLAAAEVDALVATYSEAGDRLHPHVGVRLGT
jgi:hypothetical protein